MKNIRNSCLDLIKIFQELNDYEILIDLEVSTMIVESACECQDNFPGDYFPMSEDSSRKNDMKNDLIKLKGKYIPLKKILDIVENYDMWDMYVDIDKLENVAPKLTFICELVKLAKNNL
jgi:hypothetical protein